MHGLVLYIYIIQSDYVLLFTGKTMMENTNRRTVKDKVKRHLSPSSTQNRKRSETEMANVLEKIRRGDHSNEDKLWKAHIKWKRFCFVKN